MSLVRLDVAPDAAHVRVVRLVAVSLARLHGVDEEVVEDVRLAVGEACGRAVAAHARLEIEAPVVVDFEGDADLDTGLTVTVSDVVSLPEATGTEAIALLTDPPHGTVDSGESYEGTPEVIALLEGLADAVRVDTGHDGTAVRLHWATTG